MDNPNYIIAHKQHFVNGRILFQRLEQGVGNAAWKQAAKYTKMRIVLWGDCANSLSILVSVFHM